MKQQIKSLVPQDPSFIKQLLDFLDQTTDPGAFSPDTPPNVPVLGLPGSLQEDTPVVAKGKVSVENVQSRTTQSELDVPQKKMLKEEEEGGRLRNDPLESLDPVGEKEVERWVQSPHTTDDRAPAGLLADPQKKGMGSLLQLPQVEDAEAQRKRVRVQQELTLGVATYTSPGQAKDKVMDKVKVKVMDNDNDKDADFGYIVTTE